MSTQAIFRLGKRNVLVTYDAEFHPPDEMGIRIRRVNPFGADFTIGNPIKLTPRERAEVSAELGNFELQLRERGNDNRGKI